METLKIVGGWIVTQNHNREILKADILVEDGKIASIGEVGQADNMIDASGCVIIPGLINLHTHISMTLMRGIADDVHLDDFLKRTFEVDARRTREDVRLGSELGAIEMLKGGTTSFLDLYYFQDEIAKAVETSGMRGFLGWAVLDEQFTTQKGNPVDNAASFIAEHKGKDRIYPLPAPQGVYVCGEETLRRTQELATKEDTLTHMHLSETRPEVYEHQKKTGKRPVHWLDDIGFLSDRLIAAHCGWVTINEVRAIAQKGARVAHCPVSNMKLATGGVAPLPEMFDNNVIVGLGTDGSSSNNGLDMFGEMKTCALLHKAHRWDATVLPAQKVLDMATIDGARALKMDLELGSIEAGKKADLAIIDLRAANTTPSVAENLISHLVYSCQAGNVRDVLVDGKLIMQGRNIRMLDEKAVLEEAQKVGEELIRG
ncbi:MAG: amidohydrolase family protein [Thermoplasmata archaeon]|nr:amidohydrolase family protein [Thermoplasmata archaeon]